MNKSLEHPVTLVTGSSRGVGLHLAEHYLAKGHRVVGCSRGPARPRRGYRHFELDIADEVAVNRMVVAVRREYGVIHHLVNNAGVGLMNHVLTTPTSSARRVVATNLLGPFTVAREASKLMKRGRYGRIVNLTTVAVPLRLEGESIYAASKAAIELLTRITARELGSSAITVNAVGPGPVDTALVRGVPGNRLESLLDGLTPRGWTQPADIANVVDFFLKPESRLVTGQIVYLGGVS